MVKCLGQEFVVGIEGKSPGRQLTDRTPQPLPGPKGLQHGLGLLTEAAWILSLKLLILKSVISLVLPCGLGLRKGL